jgi:hypothetical protein
VIKLKGILHSCLTATILMLVLWGAALISTLIVVAMPLESSGSIFKLFLIFRVTPPNEYSQRISNWII